MVSKRRGKTVVWHFSVRWARSQCSSQAQQNLMFIGVSAKLSGVYSPAPIDSF